MPKYLTPRQVTDLHQRVKLLSKELHDLTKNIETMRQYVVVGQSRKNDSFVMVIMANNAESAIKGVAATYDLKHAYVDDEEGDPVECIIDKNLNPKEITMDGGTLRREGFSISVCLVDDDGTTEGLDI